MNKETFIGRKLCGDYELLKWIGEGTFANVYKARDKSNSIVAVKLFKQSNDKDLIDSFKEEAKTTFSLQNAHILPIYWYDLERMGLVNDEGKNVQEEFPFIVMKFVDSGSLRNEIENYKRIPPDSSTNYLLQAASGVQFAHDKNKLHRDLKPENLLLNSTDNPLKKELFVADFGLAVTAHSRKSMTLQIAAGTLPYMPPEQFIGAAEKASDQYSLGIITFEMLTGQLPIRVNSDLSEAWFNAQLKMKPSSFRSLVPVMNPALERMEESVNRALEKSPADRYPSVGDFAHEVKEAFEKGKSEAGKEKKIFEATPPPYKKDVPPVKKEPVKKQKNFLQQHKKGLATLAILSAIGLGVNALNGNHDGTAPTTQIIASAEEKTSPETLQALVEQERTSWSNFLGKPIDIPAPPENILVLLKNTKPFGNFVAHYFPRMTLEPNSSYPGYVHRLSTPFNSYDSNNKIPTSLEVGGYWGLFDNSAIAPATYTDAKSKLNSIATQLGVPPEKVRIPTVMEYDVLRNIYFPNWGASKQDEWTYGDVYGNPPPRKGEPMSDLTWVVGSSGGVFDMSWWTTDENSRFIYRPLIIF